MKSNEQLKVSLEEYLQAHPECTAVVVQPSGEIRDIIQGNDAISGYLQGLSEGRAMTPRSWFGERETPEALLSQVKSIIETTPIKSSFAEDFKQFDLAYEVKYGPQGGTPPIHETVEVILHGFSPSTVDEKIFNDPLWQRAKQNLVKRYQFRRTLKPWSFKRVIEDKSRKGRLARYAGFPTGKRKTDKGAQDRAIRDAQSGKCFMYPAMILFRFYRGKLRMVWMYPFSMTLVGSSFESAIMEHIRKLKLPEFAPWEGFDQVKPTLTGMWNPKTQIAFGGDTSAMDDHMLERLNIEAYDVLKYAFEERYDAELLKVIRHENHIPLLISTDVMLTGPHGKASGADFTQLTETIYQAIIHEYLRLRKLPLRGSMYLGDDYVAVMDGLVKWADVITETYAKFGLPSKIEKQSDEEGKTTFLQRMFVGGWSARRQPGTLGGVYSILSALRSLVFPENWVDPEDYPGHFSDMFCLKVFQILENTVDSPYFENFVKWAAHKQKDLIPFAKLSQQALDKIWTLGKSVRGVGESYNQEKQDKPISSYESIAVMRRL